MLTVEEYATKDEFIEYLEELTKEGDNSEKEKFLAGWVEANVDVHYNALQ